MIQVAENCFQFRGNLVSHYALLDENEIVLIDGGFLSFSPDRIEKELASAGLGMEQVGHILLTHGHIDHTRNLAELKRRTGACLHAPRMDEAHIRGKYDYDGVARFCGWVEAVARCLLRFEVPAIDEWFEAGDTFPFWGGLEAIGLPGHTSGHCGFYSESRKILFAGDLFANIGRLPHLPPPWLNTDSRAVRESLQKAAGLDVSGGVLISHCHGGSPQEHRDDLKILANRILPKL